MPGCAPGDAARRRRDGARRERVLRRLRSRALPEPGLRSRRSRRSAWRREGRALGPRRGHHRASIRRCARGASAAPETDRRALRRAHHAREGRRPARRGVPAARARSDPRLRLVLAGGGPGGAALRERVGERAEFLGWLDGPELARAYAERRRVPVPQPHRHVRPGRARGAGERPAGGRRRRGRSAVADRATASAACLCAPDARRAGRRAARAGRLAARCASASRGWLGAPCASARGSARCSASATATGAARGRRSARVARAAIARKPARTIAVALHDIEPATFERCALIRDWLTTTASTASRCW